MALFLDSGVTTATTLDFIYHRKPRELIYTGELEKESQGKISHTAGQVTCSGTGTAFASGMIGSVLRLSSTATKPTSFWGQSPFADERDIKTVASTTTLNVKSSITSAHSSVAYVISDPIDIDPSMEEAFLRCCEKHLAIVRRMPDLPSITAMYEDAYVTAKIADDKVAVRRAVGGGGMFHRLADYPTGDDVS